MPPVTEPDELKLLLLASSKMFIVFVSLGAAAIVYFAGLVKAVVAITVRVALDTKSFIGRITTVLIVAPALIIVVHFVPDSRDAFVTV